MGAVNVIANQDGKLLGHNTDIDGFLAPLRARGVELKGARAVVVGAGGGAAAAAAFGLLSAGAEVALASRTPARAQALAQRLSRWGSVSAHPLTALPGLLPGAGLLVHATPVGMHPHADGIAVPLGLLHAGLFVYDLVYNPPRTRLLSEAASRGARVLGGLEMLVWQGVKALELWTGRAFPPDVVPEAIARLGEVLSHG